MTDTDHSQVISVGDQTGKNSKEMRNTGPSGPNEGSQGDPRLGDFGGKTEL